MARPQPVTATVTKPDWMKVQATTRHCRRSFSFDSTGSTASLVSILDHDSYVEDSDCEMQDVAAASPTSPIDQHVQNSSFDDYTEKMFSKEESEIVERRDPLQEESFTDRSNCMSPWEKWLLEKEKEKRERLQEERAKKTLEEIAQIDRDQRKLQKKIKESENTFLWIQEKDLAQKLRRQQEKEKLKLAMQEETRKKNEISEKAKKEYTEWLNKKKEEEKAAKKAETERKREEEENKRKKEALAKEKYNEWKKRAAKTHVKPTTTGKGYLSGKLIDYHNRAAYPPPSFYNPIPWKPLSIPTAKTDKKPNTSKISTGRRK